MNDRRTIGHVATAILVIALLHFAKPIFAPLVFSFFVIALARPVQAAVQRRAPKLLALLITLGLTVLLIVVIGSLTAWAFGKLAQWLFLNVGRFQAIYTDLVSWLEAHGIHIVGPVTDRFNVAWFIGVVQGIAGRLNGLAGFAVLVFVFTMLGLLEIDEFVMRLCQPVAQPFGDKILRANRKIGTKLRRFIFVRTLASVLTGFAVWAFALAAGLEIAVAWGAIAFVLNYIPFLGSLVATTLPTLFAIAQFDSLKMAIFVFVGLNVIQFIIGSYFEPLLAGVSLELSPFAVIFAVFFWTFLWGIAGAFIGVPMLIAFIAYCEQAPSSRWLAALLSRGTAVTESTSSDLSPR